MVLPALILALFGAAGCGKTPDSGTANGSVEGSLPSKPVRLKVVSFYNTTIPILGQTIVDLANRTRTASGGSVDMKVYEPNQLVGPMEILDSVSDGKVQAGYAAAGFWMGKMPAAPLFSAVPFGPGTPELIAWMMAGNGMRLYQEMYDHHGYNVKVLICSIIPPETSGWFAKEILSVEDLRGLKIRFYGLGGSVLKKLGAAVNILPAGEIFPALEKGVIEATEFSLPVIDENLGFYKLVKNNYFPGWHQQSTTFELLINKDTWNTLSTAQQTIVEMACQEQIVKAIAAGEATQAAVLLRNTHEHSVKNRVWSDDMLTVFRNTWTETAAELAVADPFFKKVWEDYSAFRKQYATWGDKAYLRTSPGAD